MQYDLEGRTRKFSKDVLGLLAVIKVTELNRNVINQLARSVTSTGANYCEANAACSRKDFKNKIFICRKEVQETKYWLEMLAAVNPEQKDKLRGLWKEAQELTLIFSKITSSLRKKDDHNKNNETEN
ncbi:MAG: four helix bundle protein [Candidatus Magasanikbacteria bacterium]|nr:four helix bundle protein [Candidatus Magasanikbacteria bacterium]